MWDESKRLLAEGLALQDRLNNLPAGHPDRAQIAHQMIDLLYRSQTLAAKAQRCE